MEVSILTGVECGKAAHEGGGVAGTKRLALISGWSSGSAMATSSGTDCDGKIVHGGVGGITSMPVRRGLARGRMVPDE